jgi:hypothetical protein
MQLLGTAKDVSERYLQAFYESVQGRSTTTGMRPNGDICAYIAGATT